MKSQVYDQERISFNVARLKKGGETFEVVVDPDAAITFKETGRGEVKDVAKAEKIFSDARKGLLASEEHMKSLFHTTDFSDVAKIILAEGEIQLTTEHRDKVREQKMRQLIVKIQRNAVDPRTHVPHPVKRIELAFDEAKIHIDEFKTIDQQLNDVVKKLQPILPLKFEMAHFVLRIPGALAGKLYGEISRHAKIIKETWLNDGYWEGEVELPAGTKLEFMDLMNSKTHGGITIEERQR